MKDPLVAICEHFQTARSHLPGIERNEDPEELHQYRVSLRRARSLLRWFGSALPEEQQNQLKSTIKAAFSPTSGLRDIDVLLLQLDKLRGQLPPELAGEVASQFSARLLQQQQRNTETIMQQVTEHCQALPSTLSPVQASMIHTVLEKKWRRKRKQIKQLLGQLPDGDSSQIHALRIAFKEVRYLLELFEDTSGANKVTRKLKTLQTDLGDFNDCCVHEGKLSEQLTSCTSPQEGAVIGAYWQLLTSRGQQLKTLIQHNRKRYLKLLDKIDCVIGTH